MNHIRIVFMGTPDFAVPSLVGLIEAGYLVVGVVTQPDRPTGRKKELMPSPVKVEAEKHGIPVLQPERMRKPEAVQELAAWEPDLIVTAAYGQILPKAMLELPKLGCINVHGSLLPKYRGGAPVQYALMNGDSVTGVTIMYMAEGLDTGDMISKVEVPIDDDDTTGSMFEKLSTAGSALLLRTLPDLIAGRIREEPQRDEDATYSPTIKREEERIDWSRAAIDIHNKIRAFHPRPIACTSWNGENFKVWSSRKPVSEANAHMSQQPSPGTVLQVTNEGIEVQTGSGTLWLTVVQPAGKKAMDVATFRRGASLPSGTVLGL